VSRRLHKDLTWLPRKPEGFGRLCRECLSMQEGIGERLRFLGAHSLDQDALNQLAKAVTDALDCGRHLAPLKPFTLGIVSNATTGLLVPALVATAARHGIALTCIAGEFGQVAQQAFASDSRLEFVGADAVLLALDYRGLPLRACPVRSRGGEAGGGRVPKLH
jgi:hypothetical protein